LGASAVLGDTVNSVAFSSLLVPDPEAANRERRGYLTTRLDAAGLSVGFEEILVTPFEARACWSMRRPSAIKRRRSSLARTVVVLFVYWPCDGSDERSKFDGVVVTCGLAVDEIRSSGLRVVVVPRFGIIVGTTSIGLAAGEPTLRPSPIR
jgi:hypothetical protein